MYCIYWIYLSSIFFLKLVIMSEAKKSFFTISNFKISLLKYNYSIVKFCSVDKEFPCVNDITIKINARNFSLNNETELPTFVIESGDSVEIFTGVFILTNERTEVLNTAQNESLNSGITDIFLHIPTNSFSANITLTVNCQMGYLSPECSDIDLCRLMPDNICGNNGSCKQDNNRIMCTCKTGYKGTFCEKSEDPCQENICRNFSQCRKNDAQKIGYECDFQDQIIGRFCDQDSKKSAANVCPGCINATCIRTHLGDFFKCNEECKTSLFKLPLSDLYTLLLVAAEGVVILILIFVMILMKCGCCRSKKRRHEDKVKKNLLDANRNGGEVMEFGSNYVRQPTIDNRQSVNSLYDESELKTFGKNRASSDGHAVSTFGRR